MSNLNMRNHKSKFGLLLFTVIFSITGDCKDSINFLQQVKTDTVFVYKLNSDLISENESYKEILEKTNAQLSLIWNPMSIFISALGLLFTILAIVVTFAIFKQSREYRNLIEESLKNHKIALDKLILENQTRIDLTVSNLLSLSDKYSAQIDKSSSTRNLNEGNSIDIVFDESENLPLKSLLKDLNTNIEIFKSSFRFEEHQGWSHKDIIETFVIKPNSKIIAHITLPNVGQPFVFYLRFYHQNKTKWIGFAGNLKNKKGMFIDNESTINLDYLDREITINRNLIELYKERFPKDNFIPEMITCVRLRGNDDSPLKTIFAYALL